MRVRYLCAALVVAAVVGVSRGFDSGAAAAPRSARTTTTLDDQVELARHGLQLRPRAGARRRAICSCARGTFDLQFMDIAATVNPATVHFRSLTEPSRRERARAELRVRPARAGEAAAQVRRPRRHAGAPRQDERRDAEEEVKARLLSYNNAPVWQIGNEIVTGLHADHIRFPELPGNLYARPTLIWTLDNDGRHAPPRRGVLSRRQADVERRLRAHRRRATTRRPISTAGSR